MEHRKVQIADPSLPDGNEPKYERVTATNALVVSVEGSTPAAGATEIFSTALEAAHVLSGAAAVTVKSLYVEIDASAPVGTYYLMIVAPVDATTPPDGAVTNLALPLERVEVGTLDAFSVDFGDGLACPAGAVVVLSTTRWALTIAGAYMAIDAAVIL